MYLETQKQAILNHPDFLKSDGTPAYKECDNSTYHYEINCLEYRPTNGIEVWGDYNVPKYTELALSEDVAKAMIKAGDSISIVDAALDKVAQMRANLGAIENRLDYTITNLMNIGERTADSRSRLLDAYYSLESSRLAKAQVIQQAGTQMLSQANQMTQMGLDLLR